VMQSVIKSRNARGRSLLHVTPPPKSPCRITGWSAARKSLDLCLRQPSARFVKLPVRLFSKVHTPQPADFILHAAPAVSKDG
jgi:hypothetical protein